MYNFNKDLIYFVKRDGTPESPYRDITEVSHILHEKAFLEEVPVERLKLNAKMNNASLIEVNRLEDVKLENHYFVNYRQGIVYFHSSKNGKQVTLTYKGQGVLLYPASRIYVEAEGKATDVVKTLKDLIIDGKTALDSVKEVSRIIANAEQALKNVDTAIVRVNEAINKINQKNTEITTAENTRVTQENIRKSNEDVRVAEETKRAQAETQRKTSETSRGTAENVRISNEDARKTAETNRNTNFEQVKTDENQRKTAEDLRNQAEGLRDSAETIRISNENTRINDEKTRKDNEVARKSSESTRVTNESSRVNAELARNLKEQERIESERVRVESEEQRKTQETKRQSDVASTITKANADVLSAIEKVNLDTSLAIQKVKTDTASAIEKINFDSKSAIDKINADSSLAIEGANKAKIDAEKATVNTITAITNANKAVNNIDSLVNNTAYKEVFSSTTTYLKNNIVSYNGSAYIAKSETTGNLPTNEIYWGLLAQRGVDGEGSVSSVNGVLPDLNGNVNINIEELGAERVVNKGVANGYASLDGNGKVPLSQVPDTLKQQTYVVLNKSERLALTNLISGDKAFERETGDSYIYDGTQWVILSDADWENVNLDWANIVNKPTSSVSNIDKAVTDSHTHGNKSVLDGFTVVDGKLKHNGLNIGNVDSVNGKTGAVTISPEDIGAYTKVEVDNIKGQLATKVEVNDLKLKIYTKEEVDDIIANHTSIEVVSSTPTTLDKIGVLYIKKSVINADTPEN